MRLQVFNDRGVSETLGYILVFAIVLTGIAGIVFFGSTMLNDAKDRNNFQNVEQGMSVVQSDMKRVAMEKAPVKTSKLHVEGGSLAVNLTSAAVNVNFNGEIYNNRTGNITYYSNTGQKTICIENGGLWESLGFEAGDLCVAPPRIYSSWANKAMVINIIRLAGDESSFGGSGTANVIMEYAGNNVYTYTAPANTDLIITIDTAYPDAWASSIEDAVKLTPMNSFVFERLPAPDGQVKVRISGVTLVTISEHTINIRPFVTTA